MIWGMILFVAIFLLGFVAGACFVAGSLADEQTERIMENERKRHCRNH